MRVGISLFFLALVAFWPQLSFPEWHGTEARRVQIAYEMLRSGDYMLPTYGGEVTITKPPLNYWVLAGVMRLAGVGDLQELDELDLRWPRLPSLLGFWVLSWIAFLVLRRTHGEGAGWAAAAGILLSPVILHEGPTAEIDPLFACLTGASVLLLALGVSNRERYWLVAGGVAGGLALMSKGPPYFLFLAGPLLVWLRHRRLQGAPWFLLPLFAVPLAYYVPLLLGPVGLGELSAIAGEETLGRSASYDWGQLLEIPGYLLGACVLVLPLGLWTLHEYRGTRNVRMQPDALLLRFFSASAVASVLLLMFFPSRPTRYLLPAVPIFLTALGPAVAHFASQDKALTAFHKGLLSVLGILGAVAVVAAPFLPYPLPGRSAGAAVLLALAPILVRRRQHLVPYALLMPLAVAWTGFQDRADHHVHSLRALRPVARALEQEMDARGVEDLQAFGHVRAAVQLSTKRVPPGDEFMVRDPEAHWVLQEERGHNWPMLLTFRPPGYIDRVRVRSHDQTFALRERAR